MTLHEGEVYCDVHGGVHRPSTNPDSVPTKYVDGTPIFLTYVGNDGAVEEAEPECLPVNWRKLWIGAAVTS